MKKTITAVAMTGAMLLGTAGAAQAGGPTCADFGWANHGEHVRDYVESGEVVGGGPAHRGAPPAPGASFCLDQANSPGLHKSDLLP